MINKLKKLFLLLTVFVVLFSCFSFSSYAVFYDDTFPITETGLTGGAFIKCKSSIGEIVIVLPYNYKDNYLTFTSSGNLYNASSNSINVSVFRNGHQYRGRFPSYSTLEYRVDDNHSYTDVVTSDILATNVVFLGLTERSNENFYFTTFEMFSLSVQICILFFVFLNWFLLHKMRWFNDWLSC